MPKWMNDNKKFELLFLKRKNKKKFTGETSNLLDPKKKKKNAKGFNGYNFFFGHFQI